MVVHNSDCHKGAMPCFGPTDFHKRVPGIHNNTVHGTWQYRSHTQPVQKRIDWPQHLVHGMWRSSAAETPEVAFSEISGMLDGLGDPYTRIVPQKCAPSPRRLARQAALRASATAIVFLPPHRSLLDRLRCMDPHGCKAGPSFLTSAQVTVCDSTPSSTSAERWSA